MHLYRTAFTCLIVALLTAFLVAIPAAEAPSQVIRAPLPDARIEIYKVKRELILYSGDQVVRTYRVGLGFTPEGPKQIQGDGRTPEGTYFVCVKNPKSKYYLSLGINYPNGQDAQRGLTAGLISQAEYQKIIEAEEQGTRPPWNTKLGGEIFIHGRGSASDWTLGCIALNDEHMRELYNATSIGTPVTVFE
jgi:murein L,D-transpeptidase YafK